MFRLRIGDSTFSLVTLTFASNFSPVLRQGVPQPFLLKQDKGGRVASGWMDKGVERRLRAPTFHIRQYEPNVHEVTHHIACFLSRLISAGPLCLLFC